MTSIHYGWFDKLGQKNKNWSHRWFILLPSTGKLYYFKKSQKELLESGDNAQDEIRRAFYTGQQDPQSFTEKKQKKLFSKVAKVVGKAYGEVDITIDTTVKLTEQKKKKILVLNTPSREFHVRWAKQKNEESNVDSLEEFQQCVEKIVAAFSESSSSQYNNKTEEAPKAETKKEEPKKEEPKKEEPKKEEPPKEEPKAALAPPKEEPKKEEPKPEPPKEEPKKEEPPKVEAKEEVKEEAKPATDEYIPPAGSFRLVHRMDYLTSIRAGNSSCYDFLEPKLVVDAPIEKQMPLIQQDTVVVSWRWPFKKPGTEDGWKSKFSPEDEERGRTQKLPDGLLQAIESCEQKYLWLDWACVPQYGRGDTMKAIELSGTCYREAAFMLMWEKASLPNFDIGKEYMTRAWTLAERMQRRKKNLQLRNFLVNAKEKEYNQLLASALGDATPAEGWEALCKQLHNEMYRFCSAWLGQPDVAQNPDFMTKSPLEVAHLHSPNLFSPKDYYVLDQIKPWGMAEGQGDLMAKIKAEATAYGVYGMHGGIATPVGMKFKDAGQSIIPSAGFGTDEWLKIVCKNVGNLFKFLLDLKLIEGSSSGWLLDYFARAAGTEYYAWDSRDLLIALLAAGVLEKKGGKDLKNYDDCLERVIDLVGLTGSEALLTVLFMKQSEDDGPQEPKLDDVNSWHPAHYAGILVLPQEVTSKWKMPSSLGDWFDSGLVKLVNQLQCRAAYTLALCHKKGTANKMAWGHVDDESGPTEMSSYIPVEFYSDPASTMIKAFQEEVAEFTSNGHKYNADKKEPEKIRCTTSTGSDESQEEELHLAFRCIMYKTDKTAFWFTGKVDAGQIAEDFYFDMLAVYSFASKTWSLKKRHSYICSKKTSLQTGVNATGVPVGALSFVPTLKKLVKELGQNESVLQDGLA